MKPGLFSLEPVGRENSRVFQEHTRENESETYAEVEPEIEYFVWVSSEAHGDV